MDWTRFASYANAVKPGYDAESIQQGNETGAGFFKGNVVFVKRINKKNVDLTRNLRKELIQVNEELLVSLFSNLFLSNLTSNFRPLLSDSRSKNCVMKT